MRIARGRVEGSTSEQRTATFTGSVWVDPLLGEADGIMVNTVFFEPGARTHWHTHEIAQVLQVSSGRGWLQSRSGEGGELTAGYVAHIPAGEEHWHGAAPDSYLVHVAVSIGRTGWLEPVSDDDYAGVF